MNLKFILFAGALAAASQVNAQTPAWIHDTISTDAGYLKNVYYSLENGQAAKVAADNWHVGLSVGRFSASIIVNTADKAVKLFEISSNTADFGTNLTSALNAAITANPMPLYNSNITWEHGAFNSGTSTGSFGYGWGNYDMATHWIFGSRVFGLITATDTFQIYIQEKQTTPVATAPTYIFKIADIDGSNAKTKTEVVGGGVSANANFHYYNIDTDAFLNREPARTAWDFVFTNYNDENVIFGNQQYKVFGVVNNEGLDVAKVDTADAEFDNIAANYNSYTYDTANNSIGRAWKSSGPSGVVMTDSLCYFVKTQTGDIWQMVFTAHNSGTASTDPGLVALKKRKVYANTTSVKTINSSVATFGIYPNPASGNVNVVVDAKEKVGKAHIMITDITGKLVYRNEIAVNNGLNAYSVSTSNLVNGNYIVTLTNGNWKATEKLVVQH
ncbi:MAG TPA: T9SS type A sorting domain-containing protein [Flavipsychrobacter sp.]|nr:T9SS type A sorting domain-containing protein [Flavipsychrobacter sp.]